MDISKIQLEDGVYNVKDAKAREDIANIQKSLSTSNINYYKSVEEMKKADLTAGNFARTLNYFAGNGGGAYYSIRLKKSSDIIDNASIIELKDKTIIAELLLLQNVVDVKSFGAKGDGITDDYQAIQKCLDYAQTNKLIVYFTKPQNFYSISAGLIVNNEITGIEAEYWDYYGIIRPANQNITMITLKAHMGFFMKNLSLGSETYFKANGILFEGHIGINIFEHIRVYNLNGFGMKFNAIYDSVLTDLSIEKCGNTEEYAFSMNNDGDTCNMTNVDRLQVEQANQKAIFIEAGTLSCVFTNIHSERANTTYNECWYLGGHNTIYNGVRIHAENLNNSTYLVKLVSDNNSYNDLLFENNVASELEGVNGNLLTINSSTVNELKETQNQIGQLFVNDSNVQNVHTSKFTFTNCKITGEIDCKYSDGQYSKFINCIITNNIKQTSNTAKVLFENSELKGIFNTANFNSIKLINCKVENLTNNKFEYTDLFADNTEFVNEVAFDSTYVICKNCIFDSNLNYAFNNNVRLMQNCRCAGTVDNSFNEKPATGGAKIGDTCYAMSPTDSNNKFWIFNGTEFI